MFYKTAFLVGLSFSTLAFGQIDTRCMTTSPYGRTPAQEAACQSSISEKMAQQMKEGEKLWRLAEENKASVLRCYSNLTSESKTEDVLTAVSCLTKNPYAGEAEVKTFLSAQKNLIDRVSGISQPSEVQEQINSLIAKKKERLYWFLNIDTAKFLFVGDTYTFSSSIGTVSDISGMDLSMIKTSNIWGNHEEIPFKQVKSFSYRTTSKSDMGHTGVFEISTTSGKYKDTSYQAGYPLRYRYSDDGKKWSALLSLTGTLYGETDKGTIKISNKTLELAQSKLDHTQITMIGVEEANNWIAYVEAGEKAKEEIAAKEKIQREAAREVILTKLKKAAKGDEDSCQGILSYQGLSDSTVVNCQLLEVKVDLGSIKQNGWLITNVSSASNQGQVIVTIKKAR